MDVCWHHDYERFHNGFYIAASSQSALLWGAAETEGLTKKITSSGSVKLDNKTSFCVYKNDIVSGTGASAQWTPKQKCRGDKYIWVLNKDPAFMTHTRKKSSIQNSGYTNWIHIKWIWMNFFLERILDIVEKICVNSFHAQLHKCVCHNIHNLWVKVTENSHIHLKQIE